MGEVLEERERHHQADSSLSLRPHPRDKSQDPEIMKSRAGYLMLNLAGAPIYKPVMFSQHCFPGTNLT